MGKANYGQRVQHPFYFTAKIISNTKLSLVSKGNRSSESGSFDMLSKGAVSIAEPVGDQFFSSISLVKKNQMGNRPVINLKDLNKNIPYVNFRMEGLFPLKEMLLPGDLICKIDLKDRHFSIPLAKKSRKHVRFQ